MHIVEIHMPRRPKRMLADEVLYVGVMQGVSVPISRLLVPGASATPCNRQVPAKSPANWQAANRTW